jgi:hypothetical protein
VFSDYCWPLRVCRAQEIITTGGPECCQLLNV